MTARKRLLQRAFGILSICYLVFLIPKTVVDPVQLFMRTEADDAGKAGDEGYNFDLSTW